MRLLPSESCLVVDFERDAADWWVLVIDDFSRFVKNAICGVPGKFTRELKVWGSFPMIPDIPNTEPGRGI
jgi:hypothetical protein